MEVHGDEVLSVDSGVSTPPSTGSGFRRPLETPGTEIGNLNLVGLASSPTVLCTVSDLWEPFRTLRMRLPLLEWPAGLPGAIILRKNCGSPF